MAPLLTHAFWNVPPGGMSIATAFPPAGGGAAGRFALGGLTPEGPATGRPEVADGPGPAEMIEASISRLSTYSGTSQYWLVNQGYTCRYKGGVGGGWGDCQRN
jgi:hypothetical protein